MAKADIQQSDGPRSNRGRFGRERSDDTASKTRDSSAELVPSNEQSADSLATELTQSSFDQHVTLLGDSRLSEPANADTRRQIIQRLQASHGNRYVQRLVDQVSAQPGHDLGPEDLPQTQRDFSSQAIQRMSQRSNGPLQAKLTVGAAGDKYEREANRVAKDVVRRVPTSSRRLDSIGKNSGGPDEPEKAQVRLKSSVQRAVGPEGGDLDPAVEKDIQGAKGGGKALPDAFRASMEDSFGSDFSGVKVHSSASSDALNQNLSSKAFTVGQDIFVRDGDYNPGSTEGQELLAHELTHVVQQNGKTIRRADGDDEESAAQLGQALEKEGIVAGTGRQIDKLEESIGSGVEFAEEKLTGWRKAIATWWDKKVMGKFPWLGTFLKGVAGLVVNPIKLGWSGVKFVVKVGWLIIKSSLTTILRNFGKIFDFARVIFGDKEYEKVDLFKDTRAWKADWDKIPDKVERGKTARWWGLTTEVIGVWGNNIRDWSGWISIVTGLIGLIPGAQASLAISAMAAGISGLIRPIATSATTLSGIINAIDWTKQANIGDTKSEEQVALAEDAKARTGRTGARVVGDVIGAAAIGVGKGVAAEIHDPEGSFTETALKGASLTKTAGLEEHGGDVGTGWGALTQGTDLTGDNETLKRGAQVAAKGVSGDIVNAGKEGIKKGLDYRGMEAGTEKAQVKSEAKDKLRQKGEAALDSLIKGLQDLHGILSSIARIFATAIKVVVEVIGGLVTVLAGIADLFGNAAGKVKSLFTKSEHKWDWSLFEGAKTGWEFVRVNWLDAPRAWMEEQLDQGTAFLDRLRENNPFKKKPEDPSQ